MINSGVRVADMKQETIMQKKNNKGSWNPVWEETFSSRSWGAYPCEPIIRAIASRFYCASDRSEIRILDMGCGPGAHVWYVAREGFSAAGVDGSPTGIRIASRRLVGEGLTADLKVGDFCRSIPWSDGWFDAVIDGAALSCNSMKGIRTAVSEVQRVLKPRGWFVSMNFTENTWGFGTGSPGENSLAFENPQQGPLEGLGHIQFFNDELIADIYSSFNDRTKELYSYTLNNSRNLVEYCVVICRK